MNKYSPGVHNFLHIKDFYNFIKDSSGDNSPTSFYYFSPLFFPISNDNTGLNSNYYFSSQRGYLEKFRFCIQYITFPKIQIKSYNGTQEGSNGVIDASNLYGTYSIMGNSFLSIDSKTIKMKILNTQSPIIEKFLYPWMMTCLKTNVPNGQNCPFPRLDMVVKFWKSNNIYTNMEEVNPEFIYKITGLFPIDVQLYNPSQAQQSGGGDNNRDVTFSFNQIYIADNEHSIDLGLGEYFNKRQNNKTNNKTNKNKNTFLNSNSKNYLKSAIKSSDDWLKSILANASAAYIGRSLNNQLNNIVNKPVYTSYRVKSNEKHFINKDELTNKINETNKKYRTYKTAPKEELVNNNTNIKTNNNTTSFNVNKNNFQNKHSVMNNYLESSKKDTNKSFILKNELDKLINETRKSNNIFLTKNQLDNIINNLITKYKNENEQFLNKDELSNLIEELNKKYKNNKSFINKDELNNLIEELNKEYKNNNLFTKNELDQTLIDLQNQVITKNTYKYLSDYAEKKQLNMVDVLKEFKAMSKNDLIEFINNVKNELEDAEFGEIINPDNEEETISNITNTTNQQQHQQFLNKDELSNLIDELNKKYKNNKSFINKDELSNLIEELNKKYKNNKSFINKDELSNLIDELNKEYKNEQFLNKDELSNLIEELNKKYKNNKSFINKDELSNLIEELNKKYRSSNIIINKNELLNNIENNDENHQKLSDNDINSLFE